MKTEEQIRLRLDAIKEIILSSDDINMKEYFNSRVQLLEWVLED